MMSPSTRIVIAGLGISPSHHLTPELCARIADCEKVFIVALTREEFEGALRENTTVPAILYDSRRVIYLHHIYRADVERRQNYRDAVRLIADQAKGCGKIALLTLGHPLYFDSVSRGLIEAFGDESVEVVPAVSSFDTVIGRSRAEVEPYFTILEGRFAVLQDIALDRRASYLFVQPDRIHSQKVMATDEERRLSRSSLKHYLEKYLPPGTELFVGRSASVWEDHDSFQAIRLAQLDQVPLDVWLGSSVLVKRSA